MPPHPFAATLNPRRLRDMLQGQLLEVALEVLVQGASRLVALGRIGLQTPADYGLGGRRDGGVRSAQPRRRLSAICDHLLHGLSRETALYRKRMGAGQHFMQNYAE